MKSVNLVWEKTAISSGKSISCRSGITVAAKSPEQEVYYCCLFTHKTRRKLASQEKSQSIYKARDQLRLGRWGNKKKCARRESAYPGKQCSLQWQGLLRKVPEENNLVGNLPGEVSRIDKGTQVWSSHQQV